MRECHPGAPGRTPALRETLGSLRQNTYGKRTVPTLDMVGRMRERASAPESRGKRGKGGVFFVGVGSPPDGPCFSLRLSPPRSARGGGGLCPHAAEPPRAAPGAVRHGRKKDAFLYFCGTSCPLVGNRPPHPTAKPGAAGAGGPQVSIARVLIGGPSPSCPPPGGRGEVVLEEGRRGAGTGVPQAAPRRLCSPGRRRGPRSVAWSSGSGLVNPRAKKRVYSRGVIPPREN